MKKILCFILLIVTIIFSCAILFSCGEETSASSESSSTSSSVDTHKHTFAQDWTVTEDGHYHACSCHPEIVNLKVHLDSSDQDGLCDMCLFVIEAPTSYTVTILDQNGNAVSGAEVKIRSTKDDKSFITDENGQASAEFVYAVGVNLWLISLPDGYEMPSREIYNFTDTELTVTVNTK